MTPSRAPLVDESTRRLCFGVLLPEMDSDYYRPMVDAVCQHARRLNVDLIFYPGGLPGTPVPFEAQLGAAFELVDSSRVDGLLVSASTLQYHFGESGLRHFLDRFEHLPLVNIGFEHPGRPGVLPENRTGFLALMRHLIDVHGHRAIALIEGPADNHDAQERTAAYLDALAAAGIDSDPRLRVVGRFSEASGRAAFEELLGRNVPFTALVCASDDMAHAAMAVAVERGLRVPGDLAVGGFDDLLSVHLSGPSLTTVNQDFNGQAGVALERLVALVQGETVPQVTVMPSRLVVRRSCGCAAGLGLASVPSGGLAAAMDPPPELAPTLEEEVQRLQHALVDEDTAEKFESHLRRLADRWLQHRSDLAPLHALLLHLGQDLPKDSQPVMERAARRLQQGQLALVSARELSDNHRRVEARASALDFRNHLKVRVTTDDLDALLGALAEGLARLRIPTCGIALYREPLTLAQMQSEGIPSSSRLILARHLQEPRPEWTEIDFPTCELMPSDISRSDTPTARVVLPLFYLQSHFGFVVLDVRWGRPLAVEELRHELSTYIHHCLLVKELQHARDLLRSDLARARRDNEALSHMAMRDELTGLFNRRGFFELARSVLATSRLTGKSVTLLFADLDGLKQINDQHGHDEGDDAIRVASQVLRMTFRQDDLVSRIGGDEFVVLTRLHSLESLPEIERRLGHAFDDHNRRSGKPYGVGCSLGAYPISLDSQESLEDILAQADRLLYAAKRRKRARLEGRNSRY